TPQDALRLVAGGVPVKEINVGNIHRAPGKEEISKFIALGPEDKAALRELREQYGITFNTKATATGDDGAALVDLNKYIYRQKEEEDFRANHNVSSGADCPLDRRLSGRYAAGHLHQPLPGH